MRTVILGLALSTLPITATLADSYTIDPNHTYPHFTISHLGFSTMHGRFDDTSGKMEFDAAKKTGSVEITIKVDSVSTGFAKRDQHLKSPDFFNAAERPEIKFKSTKVDFKGDVLESVHGDLTLNGVTKPITLKVTAMKCGSNPMNKKEECGFGATASLKRSEFGMNYGLPAIGDDVGLDFEVEAVKN